MSAAISEVRQQSPTRVDLAGGTLDCWPLYLFLDNPVTINVAIDIFTGAELKSLPRNQLRLATRDLKVVRDFESWPAALASTEPELAFHRCILQYFFDEHRERVQDRGLSLETWSQSPVGGGLGGSSSLTISVLKALSAWLELKWSVSDVVRLASHLEARMLLKPTGTQDYFPPLEGGLCVITYGAEGPRHVRHRFEPKFFAGRFALVYTGRSHHSGINNWQVIKDWLDGDRRTREAMADLATISKQMTEVVLQQNAAAMPDLLAREYEARTRLSDGFSSPEIRALHEIARSQGGHVKICGAGGGGCVMLWSPNQQIEALKAEVRRRAPQCQVLEAQPWQV